MGCSTLELDADASHVDIRDWDDDYHVSEFLVSATIIARKPEVADE
ncbi:hypothetical protein [Haloplanus rubicundus]|nr:hypothetical protein [Haloplanus rubicundus]